MTANLAPFGAYPCSHPDSWIVIACENDDQWGNLRTVIGSPAWADNPAKVWLAADSDAVHLFVRPADGVLLYARWNRAADSTAPGAPRWSEPVSTGLRPEGAAAAMVVNKRRLFVFAEPAPEPDRVTVRIAQTDDQAWNVDRVLHVDETAQSFDAASVVITSVAQTIAVAEAEAVEDRSVSVSIWDPGSGARIGEPQSVATDPPSSTVIGEDLASWLLLATVSLLFVVALRRRRFSRSRRDTSDP